MLNVNKKLQHALNWKTIHTKFILGKQFETAWLYVKNFGLCTTNQVKDTQQKSDVFSEVYYKTAAVTSIFIFLRKLPLIYTF